MTQRFLEYPLIEGYLHNWLVAGPQARALEEPGRGAEGLRLDPPPVDRGKFSEQSSWRYLRSGEDHQVDVSTTSPVPQDLEAWAYTRLRVTSAGEANLTLAFTGKIELWLNRRLVYQGETAATSGKMQVVSFSAVLDADNELAARVTGSGIGATAMSFSLRVEGAAAAGAQALVPTNARFPHRFQQYEELFDHAFLKEAASYRGRVVMLHFDDDTPEDNRYSYSIQDANAMIYVEGTWDVVKQDGLDVGHPQRIFERPGAVVLRAPGKEYFDQDLRYQRALPIYILDNEYSETPYGDYLSRRAEALQDAARRDGLLFAEMAKMVLEKWDQVDRKAIAAALGQVQRRELGSELALVGLFGLVERFGSNPAFPGVLFEGLEEAVTQFAFAPGLAGSGVDFANETSALLAATAEILAGQRYPDRVFAASGKTGAEHRLEAEEKVEAWLRRHGAYGFAAWDSPDAVEGLVVALTHLISLSENEMIRDFSAVLLDKVLFLMAVNSFRGVLGGSMGAAGAAHESAALKSGRVQATSSISRLLWGTGVFSARLAGAVSLALSEYEFPTFFAEIAQSEQELWGRERHQAEDGEVNKVVYRTSDYLLGSAQDYRPGQRGAAVHAWQAVLGPDALVFTTHPGASGQQAYHQPGYWLGSGALPRVAQWKDTLVAVYNIPADAPMAFTHAFFPMHSFDESVLEGGWAFGRKGDGYVALTASSGIEPVRRAPDGHRELRAPGRQTVWVCQMGRAETDGSFAQFREKILAQPPDWTRLGVRFTSPSGQSIAFGWDGDFVVNGEAVALTNFPHVDNAYCSADFPARSMDIAAGETVMRLDFE